MKRVCGRACLAWIVVVASAFLGVWPGAGRAEESPGETAGAPARPQVARALFARAIVEREPQDVVSDLDAGTEKVFFFTELLGMEGQTVRHRWELGGEVVSEIEFRVGAARWRVYSSKSFLSGQTGPWTVSVVDEAGRVLRSETLGRAYADKPGEKSTAPAAPAED